MAIARKLKIPRVVFPGGAGVMSALGLLISPLAFELARSRRIHVADIDAADFAATFHALERDAKSYLLSAGIPEAAIQLKRRLDMRYQGQGHEIEVTLPDAGRGALFADLARAVRPRLRGHLHAAARRTGRDRQLEGRGSGAHSQSRRRLQPFGPAGRQGAQGRRARLRCQGRMTKWPVYDRYALARRTVAGPALIEERESTASSALVRSATVERTITWSQSSAV
jgi:N-methylhydantoinase A